MKKIALLASIPLMLSACAGMFGGGNPEITKLANTSSQILSNFISAHIETTVAYACTFEAVNDKTEAEKIKAEASGLRDEDGTEKLEASINSLNEIDLSAKLKQSGELSKEGKLLISKALLHLGIAIFYDAKVAVDAPDVVVNATNISKNLGPKDAMAAGQVKTIIDNSSFVADIAPNQLTKLKDTFAALKSYAEAHGIDVPSQEEIEKEASNMERE